ncbi:type II secretion system inner membrane protein GspF [Pseudofulvimonas gallinarii]|jgi:general secretion pathway protein F|uniref:General secretion pathway protein F n=1 Tax=Pseudofulvimonas gallinarii TaxID=634155 RepID=A0A4S3KT57_9GAMM|nr:type II secretion system inner membrane protein GspF [Pseudofulvimonas gallinarii]TCT00369.1 general secretion pathway protein F [Pseudofulvimonas gallinarii]THD12325.1 type II secretion system protein GspF [Pseudofulvimonas gallinarii]
MTLYRYTAVTPAGDTLEGQMEAASAEEVIAKVQDAGNIPLSAVEADAAGGAGIGGLLRKQDMSPKQITAFTDQLATLMGAGQPLDRALQILLDLPESEKAKKLIGRVRDQVREGSSLSDALEAQHSSFSRLYINMVRAGEIGGTLERTLRRLAEYMDRAQKLRSSVISALIYPAILVVAVLGAIFMLLMFVVPQFVPMFEDMGAELPLMTRIVLAFGDLLTGWWWLLIGGVVLVAVWFQRQMAQPDSRRAWDERFLRMGMFGTLVLRLDTARLARTLGTLLQSGVPLLQALSIARNVLSNTVLAEAVDEATELVKTGDGLAYALGQQKRFPKLALQMVAVGEESGELDTMLLKVADTFDSESRATIDRLLAALTPVLTLVMALTVGLIMMALLLPIMTIMSTVGA